MPLVFVCHNIVFLVFIFNFVIFLLMYKYINPIFWIIAFVISCFHGIRANLVDPIECNPIFPKLSKLSNIIYKFIFHFSGSVFGFVFMYVLLIDLDIINNGFKNLYSLKNFILLFFGYIGFTGHNPQMIYGFVISFGGIAKAIISKLTNN